mmetsp:Transcript_185/g.593  ORF Transcript_185/g.593 Transcript_185/m.593 type:complete len:527 (+) Transcript_185:970-2550(+)
MEGVVRRTGRARGHSQHLPPPSGRTPGHVQQLDFRSRTALIVGVTALLCIVLTCASWLSSDTNLAANILKRKLKNKEEPVTWLKEAVKIPSVSVGEDRSEKDLIRCRDHFISLAKAVGLDEVRVVGKSPGVILARSSSANGKRKVLVYAHWDVQPARVGEGGWEADPFTLRAASDGRLYGRGASDDKAALVGWLYTLYQRNQDGVSLDVDFRLLAEGEEEIGSPNLEEVVKTESQPGGFIDGMEFALISDGGFIDKRPCVMLSTRGVVHLDIAISGPNSDLHSGTYGGGVHEPLSELVNLLSTVSDGSGTSKIDGLEALTFEDFDKKELESFDLDIFAWANKVGLLRPKTSEKGKLLRLIWDSTSVTVHGIRASAAYDTAAIPANASAHMSVRIPAGMDPTKVQMAVKSHLASHFQRFESTNSLQIAFKPGVAGHSTKPGGKLLAASKRAYRKAFGVDDVQEARLGGSIPVAGMLTAAVKSSEILVVPISGSEDGAHGYESIETKQFAAGIRLFHNLLDELGTMAP